MALRLIEGGLAGPSGISPPPGTAGNGHRLVTVVSLPSGISAIVPKPKLPERPPPPGEPRSYFLPIAGVIVALFAIVALPALSAANDTEEAEAAPVADEEVNVTLTLRTDPEGATVKLGDEVKGTTPCDIELLAGEEVTLVVEKEGFAPLEHTITPEVGAEPIDLALSAAPFVLVVDAPEGASVKVNGEVVEDPSSIELGTELGEAVAIEVTLRGFRPFAATVEAAAFTMNDGKRTHTVQAELQARARPRPAATMAPAPEPEPEGPVPSNPF